MALTGHRNQVYETIYLQQTWRSTCFKLVDNLQQTSYRQAGASDVSEPILISALYDCKVTNLRASGCGHAGNTLDESLTWAQLVKKV